MAAFNDFAVDPCLAEQIRLCIKLKECLQQKYGRLLDKITKQYGSNDSPLISSNTNIRVALNETYQCIISNLQAAYANAGETFPALPTAPTAIDFSGAAAAVQSLTLDLKADPLAFLESIMIIEKDEDGVPTFIRCPPV